MQRVYGNESRVREELYELTAQEKYFSPEYQTSFGSELLRQQYQPRNLQTEMGVPACIEVIFDIKQAVRIPTDFDCQQFWL